ncbi:MAG TPA: RtcB family protein [Phycisphaerales bacterium]|nr:RtcB family protein [Phycisphaerales bacterium]
MAAEQALSYSRWGNDIDDGAHEQMRNACALPVSRAAALMPDAHVGYGLPIGGVLATENAVIPYAVGVDIACRVMVSVYDKDAGEVARDNDRFTGYIERNTLFGVGKQWKQPPEHAVLDDPAWGDTQLTRRLKDVARHQLGTSGSGNHFVEFGEFEAVEAPAAAPAVSSFVPGRKYLAMVSHSGSRGPGSRIADHYSKLAREQHPELPKEQSHLAWLDMDRDGAEYWAAMELMGKFASANHHIIHQKIARSVGAPVVLQVENHHNFAWREKHTIDGEEREVIVHRKGATPASKGTLGYIPGSMAAPGYLVVGRGEASSLDSASHGAGRRLSRTKARATMDRARLEHILKDAGVRVLSAGLDESPHAYKNIDEVMAAQGSLVTPIARFMPRLVKMAPEGERAED